MLKKFLKSAKEILFPNGLTCDICGRETFGGNICPACAETLVFNDKARCPICGRNAVRPEICPECKAMPPAFSRATSVFSYEGGAAVLIRKFKNGGGYLKEYFADEMCKNLKAEDFDCIVCIPLTRRAEKKRGYNQSELLARAVSERLGVPFLKGALSKVRDTAAQKNLNREERGKNLAGIFKAEKGGEVSGKRVLIVDDVLTTGATCDEAAKTLLKAGASQVFLATAASVGYKILNK